MKKLRFLLIALFLLSPLFSLEAQTVDLLWQGDGYVPPFYQGRTLWSKQGVVNIVAIPHGLGNPTTLNYKWTKNGTVLGDASGVGQNSIAYMDLILSKPQTVKVEIVSGEEAVLASASVTLTPISPLLAVYENNSLYGFLFHREASGTYLMKEKEISFAAFPFFFNVPNPSDGAARYSWRADGSEAAAGNLITYRVPENSSGLSSVSVRASHTEKIIQEASKSFLVQFGEQ